VGAAIVGSAARLVVFASHDEVGALGWVLAGYVVVLGCHPVLPERERVLSVSREAAAKAF
jgi:hypothetical protein